MIGTIRHYFQGAAAKILLWLSLIALVASTGVGWFNFSKRFQDDSLGTVNEQGLGYKEFRRRFNEIQSTKQQIKKLKGPQADMFLKMYGLEKDTAETVLNGLVYEKVLQSAADSLGMQVDPAYLATKLRDPLFVREYLSSLIPPQALVGGTLDTEVVKYNLERQGITEEEFEDILNDTFSRNLFTRLIKGATYVPNALVRDTYNKYMLKKKFAIISVPFESYLAKARLEKISDKDLEDYFVQHKETYCVPEKRSARLWTFEADNFGIDIPEKDLQDAYNKRKRSFIEKPEEFVIQRILLSFTDANKVDVRSQAQELLKEVKANPDLFEAVAAKNSQAKEKGAKITFKRGEKNPLIENSVVTLNQNDISPVLETNEGFEIIKLVAKKSPVFKPFDKVRDTLAKSLKQEKFANDFRAGALRIVSQATELPELFTRFIADKKGQQSIIKDATLSETQQSEKLFGLSKPTDKAFYQDAGKGYIVELSEITKSFIPELAVVKDAVLKDMYAAKAKKLLEEDMAQAQKLVNEKKETFDEVAKTLKGTIQVTDWVNAQNEAELKKLSALNLPILKLISLTTKGSIESSISATHGYLVELRDIEAFDEKVFNDKKGILKQQLLQEEARALVPSVVQALKEKAQIKINNDVLRSASRV